MRTQKETEGSGSVPRHDGGSGHEVGGVAGQGQPCRPARRCPTGSGTGVWARRRRRTRPALPVHL